MRTDCSACLIQIFSIFLHKQTFLAVTAFAAIGSLRAFFLGVVVVPNTSTGLLIT